MKSSFCDWGELYKSGAYAGKVLCLTLEICKVSGESRTEGARAFHESDLTGW